MFLRKKKKIKGKEMKKKEKEENEMKEIMMRLVLEKYFSISIFKKIKRYFYYLENK